MTRKEKAKAIRKELKARGIPARVTSRKVTYSDSIDVTITDLSVNLDEVKKIAEQHESIRRCEYTGDILDGANTYIHVNYDYYILKDAGKDYMPIAEKLFNAFENHASPNIIETVAEKDDNDFLLWPDSFGKPDALVVNTPDRQRAWVYAAHSTSALSEGLALIDAQYNLNLLVDVITRSQDPEAEAIAERIRANSYWDVDLLRDLCKIAGLDEEWEQADAETFELVAEKAAALLNVKII